MSLKLAQICDDPPKIPTKSSYPKKIFIFLKTQKNIEIQNFGPPKNGPCLRMCENIRVPPWGLVAVVKFCSDSNPDSKKLYKNLQISNVITSLCGFSRFTHDILTYGVAFYDSLFAWLFQINSWHSVS